MIEKVANFCKNFLDWFKSDRCFMSYFIKGFPFANNLLLITLGLFMATFNTLYFGVSMQYGVNILIITLVLALLSSAIASGFCYIVKTSIEQKDSDKDFNKFNIRTTFDIFYTGVGKHYLSFLGGFVLFFIILIVSMMLALLFANKFICPLSSMGLDIDTLQLVLSNQDALNTFASQMTKSQIFHLLELFYITNIITPGIVAFMLMLWVPEFMYSGKNVFVALFTSIKKLFSDFWNALCIYIIIMLGHFIIALICALFPQTSIMLYVGSLIFIYWMIYNIYTVFLYYKSKYVDTNEREWIA